MKQKKIKAFRGSILHFLKDPIVELPGETHEYFEDGLLIIENGYIQQAGDYSELKKNLPPDSDIFDYRNKLIMPGFVDTHLHYPQTDMIASYGKQLLDWLENYTFPKEKMFEDIKYAEEVADFFIEELLRNGTTTAQVMCTVHKKSVDVLFKKALKKNLRMIAGKVMMDRNGPVYLLDTPEKGYDESRELIETWHGKERLLYAVTLRFAPTSTEEQLKKTGELLELSPDLYLHTHLSENSDEIAWVKELFPWSKSYLDVYDKFGLVNNRSIFAHSIHLPDEDYSVMSEKEASVSFCPTSNLFIGSGLFDLEKSDKAGIKVGMGTDVGGGTSFSMLKTLGEAYKVLQLKSQNLSPFRAFYLGTLGGAKSLSLENKTGNFVPGKEGDFIVLNYDSTPLIKRRIQFTENINEKIFVLMIMGDDRAIDSTYIMGEKM